MSRASDTEVFVIVLNWNGWKDTIECLESLQRLAYSKFRMVVVDNGSDDESTERIEDWARGRQLTSSPHVIYQRANKPLSIVSYSKAEAEAGGTEEMESSLSGIPSNQALVLVRTGTNLGFAGGCNVGIRYAMKREADYMWLLNNDTIVDPEALSAMVALAESDEKIGLVGSTLYYSHDPKSVQAYGGGIINWWSGTNRLLKGPVKAKLDFLTAASLLIKRSVIESVGLLDESFFFYWDDVAYCRRAVEAGWELAVAERSRILHKEGGTVSSGAQIKSFASDKHMIGSTIRFFGEYGGPWWPVAVSIRMAGMTVNRLRRRQADRILPLLVVATHTCRSVVASKARSFFHRASRRSPE